MNDTKPHILTDTEVYLEGEGYNRTVILSGWDPSDNRRIGQASIRVDRVPGNSYAKGSVWTNIGWVEVVRIPNILFWTNMPGWERAGNSSADNATRRLAIQVMEKMAEVAEDGDLF